MEINAQSVIDNLAAKIGSLEAELAIAKAQIDALQVRTEQPESPVEGEIVGD